VLARAVALQYICQSAEYESSADLWLLLGIAGYITGLFLQDLAGRNEYGNWLHEEQSFVCREDVHRLPLSSSQHGHPAASASDFVFRKASLVMRMIERHIGSEFLREVITAVIRPADRGLAAISTAKARQPHSRRCPPLLPRRCARGCLALRRFSGHRHIFLSFCFYFWPLEAAVAHPGAGSSSR